MIDPDSPAVLYANHVAGMWVAVLVSYLGGSLVGVAIACSLILLGLLVTESLE